MALYALTLAHLGGAGPQLVWVRVYVDLRPLALLDGRGRDTNQDTCRTGRAGATWHQFNRPTHQKCGSPRHRHRHRRRQARRRGWNTTQRRQQRGQRQDTDASGQSRAPRRGCLLAWSGRPRRGSTQKTRSCSSLTAGSRPAREGAAPKDAGDATRRAQGESVDLFARYIVPKFFGKIQRIKGGN